jgi:hypothetical protein
LYCTTEVRKNLKPYNFPIFKIASELNEINAIAAITTVYSCFICFARRNNFSLMPSSCQYTNRTKIVFCRIRFRSVHRALDEHRLFSNQQHLGLSRRILKSVLTRNDNIQPRRLRVVRLVMDKYPVNIISSKYHTDISTARQPLTRPRQHTARPNNANSTRSVATRSRRFDHVPDVKRVYRGRVFFFFSDVLDLRSENRKQT